MSEPFHYAPSYPPPSPGYPVGGYPGHYLPPVRSGPPPRPPRRGGWLGPVVTAVAVLLLGLVAAGGYGAYRLVLALPAEPPQGAEPSRPTVYVNQPGAPHTGDLGALMPAAPAGAQPCDTRPAGVESLDLESAAATSDRPGAYRAMLQRYGFQRGAARCWMDPSGPIVVVRLLQFDSAEHAAYHWVAEREEVARQLGAGRPLDGQGVPGGWLHVDREPDDAPPGGVVLYSGFQRGDVVGIVVELQIAPERPEHAIGLSRQQYERL